MHLILRRHGPGSLSESCQTKLISLKRASMRPLIALLTFAAFAAAPLVYAQQATPSPMLRRRPRRPRNTERNRSRRTLPRRQRVPPPRQPGQRHLPQRKLRKPFRLRRRRRRRAAAMVRSGSIPKRTSIIRKVPNGTVGPRTGNTKASKRQSRKATTPQKTRNNRVIADIYLPICFVDLVSLNL